MITRNVLIATVLICSAGCQMAPQELTESDIAEIHRLEQDFLKAVVESDFDKVVALRTEDLVWMPPGASTVEGKNALLQSLSSSPVRALSFNSNPLQTVGRNGLAYNRGEFTWTGLIGQDTLRENGKYLQIWKKQSDGSWLIALDIWNSNPAAK